MPKSHSRRKVDYTAPETAAPQQRRSYPWVAPAMLFFFLLGLVWLSVYYITSGSIPVMEDLGAWNMLVGFGMIMVGFALATQWR